MNAALFTEVTSRPLSNLAFGIPVLAPRGGADPARMSYFRSLLEAAMGNEEMPANIEVYEQEVGDAEYDEVDDDDEDDFDSADQGDDDADEGDDDEDYADEVSRSQRKRARKKPVRQRAHGSSGSEHALPGQIGGDAIGAQAGVAREGYYRTSRCVQCAADGCWCLDGVLTGSGYV